MVRAHRIPIVGLVLGLACNHRPDDATTTATTSTSGAGDDTLGGSDTGAVITTGPAVTNGAPHPTTTTGSLTTGDTTTTTGDSTDPTNNTGTSTGEGADASTGTTGPSCVNSIGDATNLDPPTRECGVEPCARGEVCVHRIDCQLLPNLCDDYGGARYCYVEQDSSYCVPIPDECKADPDGLEACLEQDDDFCNFGR